VHLSYNGAIRNLGTSVSLLSVVQALQPSPSPTAMPAPAASAAGLTPTQIYDRTVAAVDRLSVPAYVAFTLEDQTTQYNSRGGTFPYREKLRVLVRAADGRAVVVPLKNEYGDDVAHPRAYVVAGPDFTPASTIVNLGMFPIADPGLRSARPPGPNFFHPAADTKKEPPVIATVVAIGTPPYLIVNLGEGTIGTRAVYHLGLTPVRDPAHYLLREIWIDKATMLPLRYIAQRFVQDQALSYSYLVTVEVQTLGNHLVNVALSGNFTHPGAFNPQISISGRSDWHVDDVSFPASEPTWAFDQDLWAQHNGETIPNLPP
jgi:hypothetical protein